MHTIRKTRGIYEGTHYIFDNTTEALKWLNSEELAHLNVNRQELKNELSFQIWYKGENGDWVYTDDGYVAQILNKWEFVRKKRDGTPRKFLGSGCNSFYIMTKFVFGCYAVYNRKDNSLGTTHCLARPAWENRHVRNSSITKYQSCILGKYKTHKKMLYAQYVVSSGDAFASFIKIINQFKMFDVRKSRTMTRKHSLVRYFIQTINDPYVCDEIKRLIKINKMNTNDFKTQLIKGLEDNNLSIEDSLKTIKEVMDNPKAGAMGKLKAAEMNLNIQRYAKDDTGQVSLDGATKNGKPLENAKFTEIPENTQQQELPDIPA